MYLVLQVSRSDELDLQVRYDYHKKLLKSYVAAHQLVLVDRIVTVSHVRPRAWCLRPFFGLDAA